MLNLLETAIAKLKQQFQAHQQELLSSPPYISRNFLESRAEILVYSDRIQVRFLTCPLQMVLRMAGFDHNTWEIPWLENRQLTFEFN